MFCRYIYFICRRTALLKIFHVFNIQLQHYLPDKTLRRDTILMISIVMTSAVLENLTLNCNYIREFTPIYSSDNIPNEVNKTTLEVYFQRANPRLYEVFGYNAGLAVYAFILHKFLLYSWNFLDIAIAVFARAMYFRFASLNQSCWDQLIGLKATHDRQRVLGTLFPITRLPM